MRHSILVAAMIAVAAPSPAHAGSGNAKALTKTQSKMLTKMARQMQRNLRRQHDRQGQAAMFEKPEVDFDASSRTIVVTQKLVRHVDQGTRDRIGASVRAQKPNLCLALRPRAIRQTQIAIKVRALRDDGNMIAHTTASPETCS